MNRGKILPKLYLLIALFVTIGITFYTIYAAQVMGTNRNLVLKDYAIIKRDIDTPIEMELSTFTLNQDISVSDKSETLLDCFDKSISGEKQVKKIYDRLLDRTFTRVITEDSQVDFDVNGDLVAYKNLDDFSKTNVYADGYMGTEEIQNIQYQINDVSQLHDTISMIEEESNLDGYKLVDCSNNIEGTWVLTWIKEYDNGLVNPYDNVNVVIDAKDGSIWLYGRNTMLPNALESSISKNEAIKAANKIISKYNLGNIVGTELGFTRPNFYFEEDGPYETANFVRLCYNITTEMGAAIYVDAETCEILGGDSTQAINARSMVPVDPLELDPGLAQEKAILGERAFNKLGYSQDYGTVYWAVEQSDMDWILAREDMKALLVCCHGDVNKFKTENILMAYNSDRSRVWTISSKRNFGDWHFVFFDACFTSSTKNFAKAFNCTKSRTCFVGWNVPVLKITSQEFCRKFLPRLGTMTVHEAVIAALWDVRNMGYDQPIVYDKDGNPVSGNICDPGFIGDTQYWGEAWN